MKIFEQITLKSLKFWKKIKHPVFLHHTGNMFGIGCCAFDLKAINKISHLKKRKEGKSYIVLIPDFDWLKAYNVKLSPENSSLIKQFWPGELTVILKVENEKFEHLSIDGKVAFRIPQSKLLRGFISQIELPIISTSINIQEQEPARNLTEIKKKKADWFDFGIIDSDIKTASEKGSTIIDIVNDEIELVREGAIDFKLIEQARKKRNILFVCTGNICRSPLAEYYAKSKFGREYNISSAGFLGDGNLISENSFKVLQENGIRAAQHISTKINDRIIYKSWLILTMTVYHKIKLIEIFPNAEHKTFTLSEFTGRNADVEDPYGMDIDEYRKTYSIITNKIDMVFRKINLKNN